MELNLTIRLTIQPTILIKIKMEILEASGTKL